MMRKDVIDENMLLNNTIRAVRNYEIAIQYIAC